MAEPAIEAVAGNPEETGFVADKPLSDEERKAIVALREATAGVKVDAEDAEYWRSDHAMHRFLVARKMSVPVAADMYKHAMATRTEHTAGKLLLPATPGSEIPFYSQPEVLRKCFPWGVVGLDRQGFPVLVERIGAIDLVGMQAAIGPDAFVHWVCWYHEMQERLMRRVCAALGKNRHKMTCLIDMGGVSTRHLSSATIGIIKRRARLEEDTYPEVVKRVFLINAPALFATVWSIVRLFVDEGTQDKMRLMGTNFLPTVTQFVDPEVIPAYLGGKLVDAHGDPECKALVSPGGLVPLSYLVDVGTDGRGLGEEVTVPHGRHSDVLLRVPAGAAVSWRWGAQAHDVAFSVTMAPAASGAPAPSDAESGLLTVTASTAGVHRLAKGYPGPVPHGLRAPHVPVNASSKGALGDPLPGAAPGAAQLEGSLAPHKGTAHHGSVTVPEALPGGATHAVVRLRWDNSYAWVHSKTLARRVDVLLRGDAPGDAATELEVDEAEARAKERDDNIRTFPRPEHLTAFPGAKADAPVGVPPL